MALHRRSLLKSLGAASAAAWWPSTAHASLLDLIGALLKPVTSLTTSLLTALQQAVYTLPTLVGSNAPTSPVPGSAVQRLSGAAHPKFVNPLPNPARSLNMYQPANLWGNVYVLRLREFGTQIGLVNPAGQKLTTVLWGYATNTQSPTSPGRTFSVRTGSTIQITYINELQNGSKPITHRMPVDTTLMWANPGNLGGAAPVPLVAHRHGGAQVDLSDGLPDAWGTPDTNYDSQPDLKGRLFSKPYTYSNNQEAGHLWYHDHALGVTRLNVHMGLAGHYFVRDSNEDYLVQRRMLPAAQFEVPLAIQDRMYDTNGRLYYPSSDPDNPSAPRITHLPEFFGDFIIVNGVPWPKHEVEPRAYRLRVLNGSDSRFYRLQFRQANGAMLGFHQVGTELGLMDAPVPLTQLLIAPGERADLVVSFKGLQGQGVTLVNTAPTPFPDGDDVDPATAAQIMAFHVTLKLDTAYPDITLPAFLRPVNGMLPALNTSGAKVRKLLLVEGTDAYGRLQTMLGTVNPAAGNPAHPAYGTFFYSDPVTERMSVGSTEIWELHNTTVDAHPVHLHLVDFRVLNRQPFAGTVVPKPMGANGSYTGGYLTNISLSGAARPAEPNEAGRKDTVIAYPGEITRILVKFASAGEYVWHCHILSHEDHEMMRRFIVA
jgi:spore coat protein A